MRVFESGEKCVLLCTLFSSNRAYFETINYKTKNLLHLSLSLCFSVLYIPTTSQNLHPPGLNQFRDELLLQLERVHRSELEYLLPVVADFRRLADEIEPV